MDIVSSTLPIYAHYFLGVNDSTSLNLLKSSNLNTLRATHARNVGRIEALLAEGILKADGDDILVPLEGTLVLPADASLTNIPLVMICHGQADSYFDDDGDFSSPEFFSFKGYSVLQNKLAQEGIGSLSINVNLVNATQSSQDYYHRIEFFFLHFLLLRLLAGSAVSISADATYPIKYFVGGAFQDMNTALGNADAPDAVPALVELKTLKNLLQNKFDFTNLGFMGHSRGASAVARMFEYFATGGSVGTAHNDFDVNINLNARNSQLLEFASKPDKDHVKCLFSLQQTADVCNIESTKTLFVVVGGTHDEDVNLTAINIYEHVKAPKVMFAVHGATHKRFNSVWRSPGGDLEAIRKMIEKDVDRRVLTSRIHDSISRVIFSSFFIATQKNSLTHYLYFTRAVRYPVRAYVSRSWDFGFPFDPEPTVKKVFDEDLKGGNILHDTGAAPPNESLVFDELSDIEGSLNNERFGVEYEKHINYTSQEAEAFFYKKETNSNTAVITFSTSVSLENYTHLSFRWAKWYTVRNANGLQFNGDIPSRVDLRNFTISLFENDNRLGNKILGRRVRSVIHRAYPSLKYTSFDEAYYWATSIVLQTVEVHKSEFGIVNPADFERVNKIVIELTPSRHLNADDEDLFLLNNFMFTKRDFTAPSIP